MLRFIRRMFTNDRNCELVARIAEIRREIAAMDHMQQVVFDRLIQESPD